MKSTRALRSRLLVAMGLSTVSAAPVLGCGGDTSSPQGGSTDGAAGASGSSGAAGTGGGSAGTSGAPNGGTGNAGASGTANGGAGGSAGGATRGTGGATRGTGGGSPATGGANGATGGAGTGGYPTVRRPFLVGASMRSSEVTERDDWLASVEPAEIPDARTAALLAEVWLKDGLEEHASVAAFARFTLLLLSVGAPPELVAESQRASLDEIRHARACFALARRYGKTDVGPGRLKVADSVGALSLAEIAALTVAEGCVGETLGALMAAEQIELAAGPDVKRMFRRIARDEARHAELAWKFLSWAVRVGGEAVEVAAREAFRKTVEDIGRMPVVDYGVDIGIWHAHGRLTCAEARKLSRDGVDHVISPCLDALIRSRRDEPRATTAAVTAVT
jgi:hypothetical protein